MTIFGEGKLIAHVSITIDDDGYIFVPEISIL